MMHRHTADEEANKDGGGTATSFARMTEEPPSEIEKNDNDHHQPKALTSAETHTRSILKGVTWRFVATMTTVTISYLVTGEVGTALQIGFFEAILKIGIYYIHERIWARIRV